MLQSVGNGLGGIEPPESRASWRSKKALRALMSGHDLAWRAARRASALAPRTYFSMA